MSVTVSIKAGRDLVELADKMVRYGIARSRSHAFNIMIEKGLESVRREVMFWEEVYRKTEEYKKKRYRIRHGGLTKLLEERQSR